MPSLPFPILRLKLLARGVLVDRSRPDLVHLGSISDPAAFLWAILPHAARSFAPSILLLAEDEAREAAVGYLYARMLDTYEDLSETPGEARKSLREFAQRFDEHIPRTAPQSPRPPAPDMRDASHLLLVDRHHLVDRVFIELDQSARRRVVQLVTDMATGMSEFSAIFERQGGALKSDQQILDYCHRVIGLPALFVMELLFGEAVSDHEEDALKVSELVQLANITRDVEKDLYRGLAYHPSLKPMLGSPDDKENAVAVRAARRDLMLLATRSAGAFRHLIERVELPWFSPERAAAVLMMLFTDRHYRACAVAAGMPTWSGPRKMPAMILATLPALVSSWWTARMLLRVERDLLAVA